MARTSVSGDITEYKCPYCDAVFSTQHDLNIHIKFLGTDPKAHVEKLRRIREETEHPHGRFMRV
jgi:uncharacterized C2H2 Zn-finger protein